VTVRNRYHIAGVMQSVPSRIVWFWFMLYHLMVQISSNSGQMFVHVLNLYRIQLAVVN